MLYCRFLFFLLFFCCFSVPLQSIKVTLIKEGELYESRIGILPKSIVVDQVTIESDVPFHQDEFTYLTGIKAGSVVDDRVLLSAADYLKKKNKFNTVTAIFTELNGQCQCRFVFESFWTFAKVKFEGVFVGRDTYRHLYGMEQGEQFDQAKHQHFVKMIRSSLVNDGYCAANVYDYCKYDHKAKTVTPIICLAPGARFSIGSVAISIQQAQLSEQLTRMQQKIQLRFGNKLVRSAYALIEINKTTQALKEYLAKKGYFNPRIELKSLEDPKSASVALEFTIFLSDRRQFVFFGNHFFDKKKLIDHCLTFGRSADLVPLSLINDELLELYRVAGFWQVSIENQQEGNKVIFLINEGSRAVLDMIEIDGLHYAQYEWIMKNFFNYYRKKKRFVDLAMLKQAIMQLSKWYKSEGFPDFKIEKQDFKKSERDEHYQLSLVVHEGERTIIDEVAVDYDAPALSALLKIKKPRPLTPQLLDEQKTIIMSYFQKNGYLAVSAKPEMIKNNHLNFLKWHLFPTQPQVRFGKTVLQGASRLPFKLIFKNMTQPEDTLWNQEQVRTTFLKLRDLQIFETIHPHAESLVADQTQKALLLKLIHDDPFEIRVRAGFQQVSKNFTFRGGTTYKAGGSLLVKNPFNYADLLRLDVDMTRFYHNVAGLYRRPWFLGFPINMTLKGYTHTYVQPVMLGLVKPLYQARQVGGMIGLDYREQKRQWGINSGFELLETNHLSVDLAQAINFKPFLIDKLVPYFYLEPNIFVDWLDDKLNPHRGTLTVISCKGMFPLDKNGVLFFKMLYEQSFFSPVGWTVLGLHIRLGYIYSKAFETIMPIDRFYLGGENSLRGYMPDLAPPLGTYRDEHGNERLVPQGGRFVMNGNLEWRFPLFGSFWGAIFEDIGILVASAPLSTIRGNALLGSTGFGLRYLTPIGPLRFDIGFKWRRRDPEEHLAAWFLTLGHAF